MGGGLSVTLTDSWPVQMHRNYCDVSVRIADGPINIHDYWQWRRNRGFRRFSEPGLPTRAPGGPKWGHTEILDKKIIEHTNTKFIKTTKKFVK